MDKKNKKAFALLCRFDLKNQHSLFLSIFHGGRAVFRGRPSLASCIRRPARAGIETAHAAECPSRLSPSLALARPSLHEKKPENSCAIGIAFRRAVFFAAAFAAAIAAAAAPAFAAALASAPAAGEYAAAGFFARPKAAPSAKAPPPAPPAKGPAAGSSEKPPAKGGPAPRPKAKKILFSRAAGGKGAVPFKAEVLAEGRGVPWGMAFLNSGEILFTEKQGLLSRLHIPTGKISPVAGAPPSVYGGQGGLLDLALHPRFRQNRRVYFSYTAADGEKGKKTTAVAYGILKGGRIAGLKTIFKARPGFFGGRHFGSRLVFDKEGFLFVTVGDRAEKQEAQSLSSHMGAVLRLTDEGAPAPGNPFAAQPGGRRAGPAQASQRQKGALPEIWSFGHRNPQGLFLHPETGELWVLEHGPKGGDELNLIKKGRNYGWPIITYGRSYAGFKIGEGRAKKGMEQPVKYWAPSISPCGLMIYSGKKFPAWRGHFFAGALSGRHLSRLKIAKGRVLEEERLLASLGLRFRNIIEGPEGFIYAATDQGHILRLAPAAPLN